MNPRIAGLIGAIGAGVSALCAAGVAAVVAPSTHVSAEMWSYPWSAAALVPVSLFYALLHIMVLIGLLGLAGAGVGRIGARIAAAGTVVLTLAELLSIPIADRPMTDVGAGLVGTTFGLGTVISAVGLLVAGVAVVRARTWTGWRRYTLLTTGIWTAMMLGLVNTPALPVAVGLYGLLLTAVFVALATAPVPRSTTAEQPVLS